MPLCILSSEAKFQIQILRGPLFDMQVGGDSTEELIGGLVPPDVVNAAMLAADVLNGGVEVSRQLTVGKQRPVLREAGGLHKRLGLVLDERNERLPVFGIALAVCGEGLR
jgi:hypothetical protein